MTDNSNPTLPATGVGVRAIDRPNEATAPPAAASGVTQIVQLDVAGATGAESLVSSRNPLPTQDVGIQAAQSSDGALGVFITGDPNGDFAGVNIIEQLVDDGSGLAMNVRVITPIAKIGADGGLMLSDAPVVIPFNLFSSSVNGPQFSPAIDTQGYASFNIVSMTGFQGFVQFSNDLVTWTSLATYYGHTGGIATAFVAANTSALGPILGRYMRVSASGGISGAGKIILRSAPLTIPNAPVNLAFIAGNSAPSGGNLAGSLAVGGGATPGTVVSSAASPVMVGGADAAISATGASAPIVRRALFDSSGRQVTAPLADQGAHPTANIPGRQQGVAQITTIYNNTAANVQDTTQVDGQSIAEMLAQILFELRIANQQRYELPMMLTAMLNSAFQGTSPTAQGSLYQEGWDAPEAYRAEPSIFNN